MVAGADHQGVQGGVGAEAEGVIGHLRVDGDGDNLSGRFGCDRIAYLNRELLAFSVILPSAQARALRAGLAADSKMRLEWNRPGDEYHTCMVTRSPEGYHVLFQKMAYNQVHLVGLARKVGFLRSTSDEDLWLTLKGFSTPLLRAWVPWLRSELRDRQLLLRCEGHRTDCAMLYATTEDLDALVTAGVESGDLKIVA